jgi:nitroreductase
MDFQKLVSQRHSTRSFSDKTVDLSLIKTIIEEAQTTASWVNSQPWKVYVATGQTLEKIKEDHLSLIEAGKKSAPIFPVLSRVGWQADQQDNMANWSEALEHSQLDQVEFWQLNRQLFKAPAILYFGLPKDSPDWSILDMGAFVQTATLSANNQGLGTMVAYEFVKFPVELASALEVDPNYDIVIGMAIGYEDDNPINAFRAKRRILDEVLVVKE